MLHAVALALALMGVQHVTPLPFQDIDMLAEAVFVGRVVSVQPLGRPKNDVRIVTFRVKRAIRGEVQVGKMLRVMQYAPFAPNVVPGEDLLWYLPKASNMDLASPVGLLSGSFRIRTSLSGTTAINDVNNELLWGAGKKLWDTYPKEEVRKVLLARRNNPKLLADAMQAGDKVGNPGPVPLELLLALTGMKPVPIPQAR